MAAIVRCNKKAFALAEVLIALFLVTMVTLVIGALAQQVSDYTNRSKQAGAVLELRNKTTSMVRNPEPWLDKLRGSILTQGIFMGCIPPEDSVTGSTVFTCPPVNNAILTNDSELQSLAGAGFNVIDTPLVDSMGEQIAGTLSNPHYLDSNGRPCTLPNPATSCPIKSTGYFFRSNAATNSEPGNIKFVVKVEKNMQLSRGNTSPMAAQYMSVDLGADWKLNSASCPDGQIMIGYLATGKAHCVSPTATCTSGVNVGIDATGAPICKTVPTCTPQFAILDPSGEFTCNNTSPCSTGVFLGYYSGTGAPMCSSPTASCPSGQIQVGLKTSGNSLVPDCKVAPTCTQSEQLVYNGTAFSCGDVGRGVAGENGTNGINGLNGNNGIDGNDGSVTVDPIDGTLPLRGNCRDVRARRANERGAFCASDEYSIGWYLPGKQKSMSGDDFIVRCCKFQQIGSRHVFPGQGQLLNGNVPSVPALTASGRSIAGSNKHWKIPLPSECASAKRAKISYYGGGSTASTQSGCFSPTLCPGKIIWLAVNNVGDSGERPFEVVDGQIEFWTTTNDDGHFMISVTECE